MAKTKEDTKAKPAKGDKPATAKPAKPASQDGIGIKELAADLEKEPRAVRAAIRRLKGGAQVGQGGRYTWKSKSDPEYVALRKELSTPKVAVKEEDSEEDE